MPIKPENQFIKGVHTHLNRRVYRMKNYNPYVAGVPDTWYSGNIKDLWVEYKYIPVSRPTKRVVPDLSQQQRRWISARIAEGRDVWVIVGCKTGGVIYRSVKEMTSGLNPDEFLSKLLERKVLAEQIYSFCCTKEPSNATTQHPPEPG